MNFIKRKPHILFLAVFIVVLAVGFLIPKDDVVINIYDTYFVISRRDFSILLSIPYISFSLIYLGLVKYSFKLINWITVFHVSASILGLILILGLINLIRESTPGDFTALLNDMKFNRNIEYMIAAIVFSIIIAQILFLTNVIFALVKGKN
jgi:hypothetical protein